MKIIRANVLGYCMGVRRAVTSAEKALEKASSGRVFTLGPLIHNPTALKALSERGLQVLEKDGIADLNENDTVIIRAHGVPPALERELKAKGVNIINATCPRVVISQKRAAEYVRQGFTVILAGDKNHGEVTGIAGYAQEASCGAQDFFYLVENRNDTVQLIQSGALTGKKIILLSQTTFSPTEFEAISAELQNAQAESVEVFNTICPATRERQEALSALASEVDGIVVIGGKASANTKRLFLSAQQLCKNVAYIESADELPNDFATLKTVGITAGASTPDSVIEEVEKRLLQCSALPAEK